VSLWQDHKSAAYHISCEAYQHQFSGISDSGLPCAPFPRPMNERTSYLRCLTVRGRDINRSFNFFFYSINRVELRKGATIIANAISFEKLFFVAAYFSPVLRNLISQHLFHVEFLVFHILISLKPTASPPPSIVGKTRKENKTNTTPKLSILSKTGRKRKTPKGEADSNSYMLI
jgi:hypothetical protein